MKFLVLLGLAVLCVSARTISTRWYELEGSNYAFTDYIKEFHKEYATLEEAAKRELIFNKNLESIKAHNRKGLSWKQGVNHLTDRTAEELKMMRGYKRSKAKTAHLEAHPPMKHEVTRTDFPPSIDWRKLGAISAIKDQGQCGSCWAFASAETIESFWYLKTQGKIMDLSSQQIASCTEIPPQCFNQGTGGCEGSSQVVAFSAIIANGGIVSEWTYPYQSWKGDDFACKFAQNKTKAPVVQLKNFSVIESNNYNALMNAIAFVGPVTISVDASTWSSYESGIYDGCNQTNPSIDHAVQLVGYGSENNVPYWIVRNSWTPSWGENGYIRLYRDSPGRCGNDPGAADCDGAPTGSTVCGTCGILYDNAYPIIAD
eukprot:PhF_6_TR30417/c1_g1_i1/m.44615/K01365/CTSL; cathepsin L